MRGHDGAVGRDVRVTAVLQALEALTARDAVGLVEPAEDVVEAAVLEHEDHEVVEAGPRALGERCEAVRGVRVAGTDQLPGVRPPGHRRVITTDSRREVREQPRGKTYYQNQTDE